MVSQTVSKSFGFVVIVALGSVGIFVFVMNVLKYGFGIDPVGEQQRRALMTSRQTRKGSIVAIRFLYVNAASMEAAQIENSSL